MALSRWGWKAWSWAAIWAGFWMAVGLIVMFMQPEPAVISYQVSPGPAVGNPLLSVRVVDGDTLEADIDLGYGLILRQQDIRLVGYDAWESSLRRRSVEVSEQEIERGKLATAELQRLLTLGRPLLRPAETRDVYGRILGELMIESPRGTITVSDHMRQAGHDRNVHPDGTDR